MYKPNYRDGMWCVVKDEGSLVTVIMNLGTGDGCRQLAIERARALNKSDLVRIVNPIQIQTILELTSSDDDPNIYDSWVKSLEGLESHCIKDKICDLIADYLMNNRLEDMVSSWLHDFELWLESNCEIVGVDCDIAREQQSKNYMKIDILLHRILDLGSKVDDVITDFEHLIDQQDEDPIEV